MVDGKPQGYTNKTRVPPSNVSHNKWVQNNAPNYSHYSHVAWRPKSQADQGAQARGGYSQRGASSKKKGNFRGRSRRTNGRAPFILRPMAQPEPFVDIGADAKVDKEVTDAATDPASLAGSSPTPVAEKKDPFRKAKSPIRVEKPSSIQVADEGDDESFGMEDLEEPRVCLEGDCDDIIPGDECKFVEDELIKEGLIKRPDEITKGHLRPSTSRPR
ncbi:hypothetical protein PIB30_097673 [Stylosanthes scabra]|uniref:Uncharacterized protein n=1 Tax=Stylosanthes scabra TaxID=79078 RepID=A0ABU6TW04_9FABA|nr:hypothetical protein [Stylosanthes scabra]